MTVCSLQGCQQHTVKIQPAHLQHRASAVTLGKQNLHQYQSEFYSMSFWSKTKSFLNADMLICYVPMTLNTKTLKSAVL